MDTIAEIPTDPARAQVYEHGWQSWSPVGLYRADGRSPRPTRSIWQTMSFRPERATLLGCGAPLLPSVGVFDAMRVSPDIHDRWLPADGDVSQPSGPGATLAGRARGWMHGRWWVNDPDCLMLRPDVERRAAWADHVARWGGLRASGDALDTLDEEGLRLTRDLLRPSSPEPFPWTPEDAVPDPQDAWR